MCRVVEINNFYTECVSIGTPNEFQNKFDRRVFIENVGAGTGAKYANGWRLNADAQKI